ncbi:hypothetical protein K1719_043651 [Acacia pycnantha]|nr:hypothetical protein K1719_043651 [Acacia pycnantha]
MEGNHDRIRQTPSGYYGDSSHRDNLNQYEQLAMDAAGPSIGQYFDPVTHVEPSYIGEENDTHTQPQYMRENPHSEAERFYKMLQEAQRPLWEGCEHFENSEYSSLSATLATLSLKTDHHMSERNYNEMMQIMTKIVPKDSNLPKDFYQAKKKVKELGHGCEKIHCCPRGCMLYYKDDAEMTDCKFCGHDRYKVVRNGRKTTRQALSKM